MLKVPAGYALLFQKLANIVSDKEVNGHLVNMAYVPELTADMSYAGLVASHDKLSDRAVELILLLKQIEDLAGKVE